MTTRTLTAMFKTQGEAEKAGQMLASQLRLTPSAIRVSPGAGVTDAGYDKSTPYAEKGFFGSIKDMALPEEDRFAYAEGMRRGSVLLNATVDEGQVKQAASVLEQAGALDLDAQETSWRQSGWTGYDAAAQNKGRTATPAATGRQDETIKVVEERLAVGKRVVEAGGVRVRAYVIERPVEAQVTLQEERLTVERHPVNRPVTAGDTAAFAAKTLEVHATREEAVVGKDVRVVEEIGLKKEAAERVETVRDTVRKTEVDIDDAATTTRTAGTATVKGGTSGTGVAGAVDKTLGTNLSGANPPRK